MCEQVIFLFAGIGFLHEPDFEFGDSLRDEQPFDFVVGVPAAVEGRAQRLDLVGVVGVERIEHGLLLAFVVCFLGFGKPGTKGVVCLHDLVVALGLGHGTVQERRAASPYRHPTSR